MLMEYGVGHRFFVYLLNKTNLAEKTSKQKEA